MMNNLDSILMMPGWYKETGKDSDVVLSSRVRFSRNIAGYPFPAKLILKDEQSIQRNIISAFKSIDSDDQYTEINMEDISPVERQMLFEKKLISRDFSAKVNKSVLVRKDNGAVCMVNEYDHLRFSAFTGGLELEKAFRTANDIDTRLENILDFAVSLEFGYLNSFIRNSGTGMKASVMLHLPFLVRTSLLERAIKSSISEGFSVKGFMGDDENSLGSLYQVSNELSIGLSEEQYINQLYTITSSLVEYERRARKQFLKGKNMELEDIFYRAYGLLKHCRLLPLNEAIKNLSDFRIGVIMGWTDIPLELVNSLIVLSQKAHLQYIIDDDTESDSKMIDYTRSELAKTYLKLLQ